MEKWIIFCILLMKLDSSYVSMSTINPRYAPATRPSLSFSKNSPEAVGGQSQEALPMPVTSPAPVFYPPRPKQTGSPSTEQKVNKLYQYFQIMTKLITLLEKKVSSIEQDIDSIKEKKIENAIRNVLKETVVKSESLRRTDPEDMISPTVSENPVTIATTNEKNGHTSISQIGTLLKNLFLDEIDSGVEPKPVVEHP